MVYHGLNMFMCFVLTNVTNDGLVMVFIMVYTGQKWDPHRKSNQLGMLFFFHSIEWWQIPRYRADEAGESSALSAAPRDFLRTEPLDLLLTSVYLSQW